MTLRQSIFEIKIICKLNYVIQLQQNYEIQKRVSLFLHDALHFFPPNNTLCCLKRFYATKCFPKQLHPHSPTTVCCEGSDVFTSEVDSEPCRTEFSDRFFGVQLDCYVTDDLFFDLNSADFKLTTLPLLPQGSGGDKKALCQLHLARHIGMKNIFRFLNFVLTVAFQEKKIR